MESITSIYRIGNGPSSSHTMGPKKAAQLFNDRHKEAVSFKVHLYGSLAATGKGHLTDKAITDAFHPKSVEFVWLPEIYLPLHPNALKLEALNRAGQLLDEWVVYSVGGGKIIDESTDLYEKQVYEHDSIVDIMSWVDRRGKTYWEYIQEREDSDFWDYLNEVWKAMQKSVKEGLESDGVLPGGLNLRRKAASYWIKAKSYKVSLQNRCLIMSYALAVSEQNASGGEVVTAPTCGAAGVLPAILYHMKT